jgi:hypothetical protein
MADPVSAARDLLVSVPLKIRRTVYGVLGLAVVIDAGIGTVFPDLIPERFGDALLVVFGLASSLLALANSSDPVPLPPPPLPPLVEPIYEGEFP